MKSILLVLMMSSSILSCGVKGKPMPPLSAAPFYDSNSAEEATTIETSPTKKKSQADEKSKN
jgi:hypothetical protein